MPMVRYLVENNADINSRRDDGISPIYLAVIGTEIVIKLPLSNIFFF